MKYHVTINKRMKYIMAYTIVKRIGRRENFLTKMLIKVFIRKRGNEGSAPV
ncbi:hypothetical protein M1397_03920 [Candidatus Marsarchaeota archaeon]|nr:hypothetical protein [Candidatus Marsarchaeota archaeon]